MLENALRYCAGIIGGIIIGFLLGDALTAPEYLDRNVFIKPDTIIQHEIEPLILKPDCKDIAYYVHELNQYRTLAGSIIISSNRIHAGLYARSWSMEYGVSGKKNLAYIFVGTHIGAGYMRLLDSWALGIQIFFDEKKPGIALQAGFLF